MTVRHPNSYEKTITQLAIVAVQPFTVDGVVHVPPEMLKLSPTFWRRYGCHLNCGACCRWFSLDFLPCEYETLDNTQLKKGAVEKELIVNGHSVTFFSYLSPKPRKSMDGKARCDFLDFDTGACMIHSESPFSCNIELIKFRRVKKRGYIGKQAYGRAWSLRRVTDGKQGVLCDFGEFSEVQFRENDTPALKRMQAWGEHLGIETHLPKIVDALEVCVDTHILKTFIIRNVDSDSSA